MFRHHECDDGNNPLNGNGNTQRSFVFALVGGTQA
jgi:hypothetical protein